MRATTTAAIIVAATLSLAACRSAPDVPVETPSPRDVVLVTIDTLRSDYVGYSGSGKVKTPNLDRLAREGVAFTETRSPVPLTLPAHASILTGELPPAHGVRVNGRDRLSESATTLAEVLKAQGYQTAAFVGSFVLDHRFGLAQGFDHYDDDLGGGVDRLETIEAERDASAVRAAFEHWLDGKTPDRPFFAWVHFYDPHAPYEPPEPYRSEYPRDPYAGEVAYADAELGRVIDALRSRGALERSLVAVVGDHGENLGEHGEKTHSVLIYNSALHVPFLLYGPGVVPPGREVTSVTRTVDVAPTLLDYLGITPPPGQGRSLRSMVERRGDAAETMALPAYSESMYARVHLGWSELRGIERGGFRYIDAPRPELYDLTADPGERDNVILSRKPLAREMKQELERIEGELERDSPHEAARLDAETESRLKSLGYVSSSAATRRSGGEEAIDPKDKMAVWNQIQTAVYDLGHERFDAARDVLETVLSAEKDVPIVYENLGEAYMALGRPDAAEETYRKALAQGLEGASFHVNLGRIHLAKGELADAERELRIGIALDPRNVAALVHLGNTLRSSKRPQEALSFYQNAVEIDPRYVYAYDGLGRALSQLGRDDDALQAFRDVVRLDAEGAQGYYNLGVQLEKMGQTAAALEAFQELLLRSRSGGATPPELARRATEAVQRLTARSSRSR